MKEIKLSQQGKNKSLNLVALVDDENFDYINQFRWQLVKEGNIYYAKRRPKDTSGKRHTISMHRIIMKIDNVQIII